MTPRKGTLVLVLILLLVGSWEFYRVRYCGEVAEMQSPRQKGGIFVFLGNGFPEQGIHQIYDDFTPRCVIELTIPGVGIFAGDATLLNVPLHSGEGLELLEKNRQLYEVKRFWMPSEKRIALFIPLHPDRMSCRDWEALPGIGPKLAARIKKNRQKNGDFGRLEDLQRVKGIGEKLIRRLKIYF